MQILVQFTGIADRQLHSARLTRHTGLAAERTSTPTSLAFILGRRAARKTSSIHTSSALERSTSPGCTSRAALARTSASIESRKSSAPVETTGATNDDWVPDGTCSPSWLPATGSVEIGSNTWCLITEAPLDSPLAAGLGALALASAQAWNKRHTNSAKALKEKRKDECSPGSSIGSWSPRTCAYNERSLARFSPPRLGSVSSASATTVSTSASRSVGWLCAWVVLWLSSKAEYIRNTPWSSWVHFARTARTSEVRML
mmetsp:Transcript_16162/g.47134  ORF Transcript_16162/g.47134 Transcript_16162/m.47134 type:complete len:258 (-) Transcript_16162:2463-3236(-)